MSFLVQQFRDAPFPSAPTTPWSTLNGAINAVATTITPQDDAFFPSISQFDVQIGDEIITVLDSTVGVWTVLRAQGGTTAATHATGSSIFHVLTASGMARSPRSMTTLGDVEYMGALGAPARLGQPGDGDWVVRYSSGVPSWVILPTIPTNTNQLTNGAGFITSSALSPYLTSAAAASTYQPIGIYVTGPASPDTSIQFNNAGSFGGFGSWDGTTLLANSLATAATDTGSTLLYAGTPVKLLVRTATYGSGMVGFVNEAADPVHYGAVMTLDSYSGYAGTFAINTGKDFELALIGYPSDVSFFESPRVAGAWAITGDVVDASFQLWSLGRQIQPWRALYTWAINTDDTAGHTTLFQAYDVDGAAYKAFATLTSGTTPDFTIAPPSGGTVTVQATAFKSSDGTVGVTTAGFKNGLLTDASALVTASSTTAFTNKTGNVSQWTNDSGYLISVTNITGNAGTATALQTARAINGVSFNGTADITITAAAGTLSGTTLTAGVTASSLTSFGASPILITPTIASFTNATHAHTNSAGGGTLAEAALALTDITTNDVSTAKHGFAPKLPNDSTKFLNGVGAWTVPTGGGGGGDALTSNPLSQFAATTSLQLKGVISDETGSGLLVFATSPSLVTPILGTPTSGDLSNCANFPAASLSGLGTGVATWLVTPSSANLLAAMTTKTGTGSLVFGTAPTLTGPVTLTEAVGSSALTITGATQTANFPALSITQTWNNNATAFTAVKLNVTLTAFSSTSVFMDFLNAGTRVLAIGPSGQLCGAAANNFGTVYVNGNQTAYTDSVVAMGGGSAEGVTCRSVGWFAFTNSSSNALHANRDTVMVRAAAATFQFGQDINGAAVSQMLQACNGITGTDKTGGNFTLASGKGTGAGAVSSLIFQTPTVLGSSTTAQSLATRLTLSSAGATFAAGITTLGGAVFHTTSSALTDGVGASAGTITNAPAIGNPTKWIGINDNGTTRYIPAW